MGVVCFFIGVFILNCCNVQLSGQAYSATAQVADATASFKTASTVHTSLAYRQPNIHLTLEEKTGVKLMMKNVSSSILYLVQHQVTKVLVSNNPLNYSIDLPGYYLFLFRYALY